MLWALQVFTHNLAVDPSALTTEHYAIDLAEWNAKRRMSKCTYCDVEHNNCVKGHEWLEWVVKVNLIME